MKLHLHVGAHKTATTHFQDYFSKLPDNDDFYFLGPENARKHFSMEGNSCSIKDSEAFYKNLAKQKYKSLLISDENICGHSYHIFRHHQLYQTVGKRLEKIEFFKDTFDEIEIWLTLRSQETFLPSFYCEALRWGNFKPFSSVFNGGFYQSWLPTVDKIKKSFPDARINILTYENYENFFSPVIGKITGIDPSPETSVETIVYASLNNLSVRASTLVNNFFPFPLRPVVVGSISKLSKPFNQAKFQPFSDRQVSELQQLYASDLKALKDDPAVSMFDVRSPEP